MFGRGDFLRVEAEEMRHAIRVGGERSTIRLVDKRIEFCVRLHQFGGMKSRASENCEHPLAQLPRNLIQYTPISRKRDHLDAGKVLRLK